MSIIDYFFGSSSKELEPAHAEYQKRIVRLLELDCRTSDSIRKEKNAKKIKTSQLIADLKTASEEDKEWLIRTANHESIMEILLMIAQHEKCCCPDCTAARHEFFAKLHPLMTKKENESKLIDSKQTLKR